MLTLESKMKSVDSLWVGLNCDVGSSSLRGRAEIYKSKFLTICLGFFVFIATTGCGVTSALSSSEQLACQKYNSAVSRAVSNLKDGMGPADALNQLVTDGDSLSKDSSTTMRKLILKIKRDSLDAISSGESGDLSTLKHDLVRWKSDQKALADHCNSKAMLIG